MTGFIYILAHPAMPGLLKIGYTLRSVEERMRELNTTGVPGDFSCLLSLEVDDPYGVEQELHDIYSIYRVDKGREFFKLSIEECAATLKRMRDDGVLVVLSVKGSRAILLQGVKDESYWDGVRKARGDWTVDRAHFFVDTKGRCARYPLFVA